MNTFGRDFIRSYMPAAQQAADSFDQRLMQAKRAEQEKALMAERMQMEDQLRKQREQERQLNDLRRGVAELGDDPGKYGNDQIALANALFMRRNMVEDLRGKAANRRKLEADAAEVGLDPSGFHGGDAELGKKLQSARTAADAERAKAVTAARVEEEQRRQPAAVRNTKAVIDKMVASGAISPDEAVEAEAVVQANNGRLPNLPAQYREDAAFNSAVLNAIGPLFKRIRDLGPDASSYFGPIDARLRSAKGSLIGGEENFRGVEQAANEVISGRAFEQGGKALTATELERITKQIGEPTNADFSGRVEQYYNRAIRDAELVRERLMNDPARFTPEGQAAIQRLSKQIDEAKGLFGVKSDAPSAQGTNPADDILAKYGIK